MNDCAAHLTRTAHDEDTRRQPHPNTSWGVGPWPVQPLPPDHHRPTGEPTRQAGQGPKPHPAVAT